PDAGGAITCQGTSQSCDDANPCTQDSCDSATGQCGHPAISCNDGNVCTTDTCDPAAGGCVRTPAPGFCNMGRLCTVNDTCSGGNCFLGVPRNCADAVQCTRDSCSESGGGCVHLLDTTLCGPEGPCIDWQCLPGQGNGCFNTLRNTMKECDGNPCTQDTCQNSLCIGGAFGGTTNPCDDHNACTTGDRCNPTTRQCQGGAPVSCDDGNPCTTDSCSASTGQCSHQGEGGPGTCGIGACQRSVDCLTNPDDCVPGTPSPETCNNIDDDCDGLVDDLGSATCGIGACLRTVSNCLNGAPQTCAPGAPTSETCNAADDDCNGLVDDLGTTTCGEFSCERTVDNCLNGVPQTCIPGTPQEEVCNALDDDCDGEIDEGQTTCGEGACQVTVDLCIDGNPQDCVPGTPAPEDVCNGIDDDCDGVVDQGRIQADCILNPSTLNLNAQGSTFNIECKLTDRCGSAPVPGTQIGTVYISRADAGQGAALPDPTTLPCPDPVLGSLYERGIVEDAAARQNSPKGATFKFDVPSDGSCATLDGDRQDLAARLAAIPDNTTATICVSGKADSIDFIGCATALVRNKGLR
ncbi:MAG TPA: hypothetical protein VFW45_13535, partial [Candidatus Polarisedimenticolia bacterium]|nr:hypothetical protein [Candidatus Polarisedimenticolia bacterium]